jgi:hypothetical protein
MADGLSAAGASLRRIPARGEPGAAGQGGAPQSLDETLSEALERLVGDLIQTTHWPNIDLIGAQLDLYWAEFQIPVWRMAGARLEAVGGARRPSGAGRGARPLRHRGARYAAGARLSDDQCAGGGRYPSGAAWRVLPGIRLHGALLRHAARHVLVDRGERERRRPRPGPAETPPSNGTRCARC